MMVVGSGGSRQGGEAAEWVGALWRMVVVEEQEGLRVVWHQIKCWCLPRLIWEGACKNIYKMIVQCLITTVWLSGNIVSVGHVTYVKAMVQSLFLHFLLLI